MRFSSRSWIELKEVLLFRLREPERELIDVSKLDEASEPESPIASSSPCWKLSFPKILRRLREPERELIDVSKLEPESE
jgi:hypothetical protein